MLVIVDDSNDLRYLMVQLLQSELKVPCMGCDSLNDVIIKADQVLSSELILLDINLGPGQPDGLAVLEWLRARNYPGKVVFFTGHAKESPYVIRAAQMNVPIIEKPMSPGDLISFVKNQMGSAGGTP